MLVLQWLYNLSDEQVEYQVRDRLSFTRFLGLGIEDGIPDGTRRCGYSGRRLRRPVWLKSCLSAFGQHLEAKGYIARGGQMVDGTIVPVPKQRNIYALLRLPWLAPDITAAIVNGRQPPQLNAKKLMRLTAHLPADWAEQQALLGFR
jgi:IS5 family transposase